MVTQIMGISACQEHFFPQKSATAARLGPAARKELSLRVLGRTESVTGLAQRHRVSRKFLYQQAAKASDAIDEAFDPSAKNNEVLFYLPVTKNMRQKLERKMLRAKNKGKDRSFSKNLPRPARQRSWRSVWPRMSVFSLIGCKMTSSALPALILIHANNSTILSTTNYLFVNLFVHIVLLRFFLNHRRFQRSDRPERIGKSPAELLNGKAHPHWLELLGFERFQRN